MATQIRRETVIGNFKSTTSKRLAEKRKDTREEREGNDNAHLAALRKCPCVVTLKMPAGEVHHLKQGTGERGAGMRSSDMWGVPLSHDAHMELERLGSRNETKWFKDNGIASPIDLAAALWGASPNVAVMTKIILGHRTEK